MMTETPSGAPKPLAKRALFNKPAWSRPQNLASPTDFFHRGNSAHVDPVAKLERKRKAKAVKKEAETRKEEEKGRQQAEAQPAGKRRRISGDSDDDLYGASDRDEKRGDPNLSGIRTKCTNSQEGTAVKSSLKREPSPKSLARRYDDSLARDRKVETKPKPQPLTIIDLQESDEGEDEEAKVTQVKKPPPLEDDDFPASDEEYAELARKARERARRKRLEDDILPPNHKQSPSVETGSLPQTSFLARVSTSKSPLDPEVEILITSRLENTIPLIVRRRLSQRLKDVRLTWCSKNQFAPDMASSVFLTWRGKRLFDVTSCKSLGIAVDRDGRVLARGQDDILVDEDRKIHMEAMTEAIYEEYQKARRRATEQRHEDEEEEQAPVHQKPQDDQVRIILKAKGFADFKLIAKPVRSFEYACRCVY